MARDNRTTLTATAQEKQRLEIELSQYQRLDGQLKMVTLLKEQERKAGELDALCETGEHLTQDVTRLNDKLTPIKRIVDAGDNLALLMSMERKAEGLESLIEKGESIRTESAHLRIRLERVRDTTDSEAMLDGLLDMVGQLKGAEGDIDNMGDQLVAVMKKQSYLKHASEQLIVLEKRWKAEFPSVCPLCGRGGK